MKVWYDISGIYSWKGSFTGIQRVVYNYGKELYQDQETMAGFFVYKHGTFQAVDFHDLEDRLRRNQEPAAQQAMTTHPKVRLAAVQHYVMVGLKRVVKGSRFEAPARTLYSAMRHVYRRVRKVEQSPLGRTDPFSKEDIVVIADGNWQFSGFAQALAQAKGKHGLKIVHLVHDLVAVRNPALANPNADKIIGGYFKKVFEIADILVAVSESTKKDIEWFVKRFDLSVTADIAVVVSGDNFARDVVTPKKPTTAPASPFILAVGTIEVRKNYSLLYYTYKLALQKGIGVPHLVIAGRKGWMAEESYALLTKDTDLRGYITIALGITDAELAWLYKQCLFTVFPSFYEGWGLPVAESLSYGKVCVSSDTSSMTEVGGSLVEYISPFDPAQFLDTIHDMYSEEEKRHRIEDRIAHDFKHRSWRQAFRELMTVMMKG